MYNLFFPWPAHWFRMPHLCSIIISALFMYSSFGSCSNFALQPHEKKKLILWEDWEIVLIPSSTQALIQLILVLQSISNKCNRISFLTPPLFLALSPCASLLLP
uniref:Uncharacterized protein n=1 Tax=Setaria italica TaxID=4555 RepID=K3ZKG8_SETIT